MVVVPMIKLMTGILMPMIGWGTWMNQGETVEPTLDAALEAGYRHIDTAYLYGNEVEIGRGLKKWFDSGKLKREDVWVTSKLPMQGMNESRVELFLNKTLESLGLDYVDLYLIHFPVGIEYVSDEIPVSEVALETADHVKLWKIMEHQVKAGRAKTIGLSNFNITQIERILKSAKIPPAVLEVEVHVMFAQKELVQFAQKNNIVVIGYSPLANPGFNVILEQFGIGPRKLPDVLGNPIVESIARKHNKTTAQIAIRFSIERKVVPIPKSVTPCRIRSNIDVFDFSLDDNDMNQLYALEKGEWARVMDAEFIGFMKKSPEWPWAGQLYPHQITGY